MIDSADEATIDLFQEKRRGRPVTGTLAHRCYLAHVQKPV